MTRRPATTILRWSDPDELEISIREHLTSMKEAEHAAFIQTLTLELKRSNLSIAVYLAMLGIPWTGIRELTPVEAGQLIRFLFLNIARSRPAIERAASQYGFQMGDSDPSGEPQAA